MTEERELEIALAVLERRPDLVIKWSGERIRTSGSGVSAWL